MIPIAATANTVISPGITLSVAPESPVFSQITCSIDFFNNLVYGTQSSSGICLILSFVNSSIALFVVGPWIVSANKREYPCVCSMHSLLQNLPWQTLLGLQHDWKIQSNCGSVGGCWRCGSTSMPHARQVATIVAAPISTLILNSAIELSCFNCSFSLLMLFMNLNTLGCVSVQQIGEFLSIGIVAFSHSKSPSGTAYAGYFTSSAFHSCSTSSA